MEINLPFSDHISEKPQLDMHLWYYQAVPGNQSFVGGK